MGVCATAWKPLVDNVIVRIYIRIYTLRSSELLLPLKKLATNPKPYTAGALKFHTIRVPIPKETSKTIRPTSSGRRSVVGVREDLEFVAGPALRGGISDSTTTTTTAIRGGGVLRLFFQDSGPFLTRHISSVFREVSVITEPFAEKLLPVLQHTLLPTNHDKLLIILYYNITQSTKTVFQVYLVLILVVW